MWGSGLAGCAPPRRGLIKQEAKKPGEKVLILALWLLNDPLNFSGFHGFLLKLRFPYSPYAAG